MRHIQSITGKNENFKLKKKTGKYQDVPELVLQNHCSCCIDVVPIDSMLEAVFFVSFPSS